MSQNTSPGGNFNWVAPIYDALSFVVFGRKLQQAQTVNLRQVPAGASILIVGGGTGWLLEQVVTQCQPSHILYLEASAAMLARSSRRMVEKALPGTVEFRLGNEFSLRSNDRFDVVMTPFVLDLFTEETLRTTFIPQLLNALKPRGLWLVTDFVSTRVWWQKALLWIMIRFFRLTAGIETRQLSDWQRLLAESGLALKQHQPQVGGMVLAGVWTRDSKAVSLVTNTEVFSSVPGKR